MTRIKVVPDAEPNAEGEWIEAPFELPPRTRWRHMEIMVARLIPPGHHVVAVEPGSRNVTPVPQAVVPFKRAD